jgi:hypothetical protein
MERKRWLQRRARHGEDVLWAWRVFLRMSEDVKAETSELAVVCDLLLWVVVERGGMGAADE